MIKTVIAMGFTAALALAAPSTPEARDDDVQTAHFVFHGGSDNYTLAVKTDGVVVDICNDLPVETIDINDYNADSQCVFKGPEDEVLDGELNINTDDGTQRLVFADPKPISSVSCEGMCVFSLGLCYENGQYVGPCCNGFCAANHCRPWNGV